MISLMVMRYSQFPGARPIHWVKAGEVRGCDRTIAVANAVAQAQARRVGRFEGLRAIRMVVSSPPFPRHRIDEDDDPHDGN